MRVGNLSGRLVVPVGDGAVDVERASGGWFPADPGAAYERWDELVAWARSGGPGALGDFGDPEPFDLADLGAPSPRPRQVFGIALNYRAHAEEAGGVPSEEPSVFTKFASSLTGPHGEIAVPEGDVDWEVELVVVVGRTARRVAEADAWYHVAGLTVGQDLSERVRQFSGATPQFSMAKSSPGFGPTGPWLVTPDEVDDPDDLELGCFVNGEQVQKARTAQMLFPVPTLVARLSAVLPLLPGDLIFTGTPAGVGATRNPPRFLTPGDELVSYVGGVGEMQHLLVAGGASPEAGG